MVERAALSEYSELLAFEERVFRVRFCGKVPKLYTDPAVCVDVHRVVKENGRIVAAIAAWPGDIVTPAGVLHAVGIGSVAVDSACRGKGYMREMMLQCDEIARAQNAALGYLSGHRQRYGYYGYAPGGVRLGYEISAYDVARAKPKTSYTFTPLKNDANALPAVYARYAAQDARWQRTEADFALTASTWRCRAYVIRSDAGAVCGYLITERFRGQIGELVLAAGVDAADVLVQFARYKNWKQLRVTVQPGQTALQQQLGAFGEHPHVEAPAMFKIYDYKKVIETLGSWKAQTVPLPEGSLVLNLAGEKWRVTLKGGVCTAEATTDGADLCFTEHEAVVALTTPFFPPTKNALFNAWAPLCPVWLPHCDSV
jgi:predicted N-acetyltransferase YhbS